MGAGKPFQIVTFLRVDDMRHAIFQDHCDGLRSLLSGGERLRSDHVLRPLQCIPQGDPRGWAAELEDLNTCTVEVAGEVHDAGGNWQGFG